MLSATKDIPPLTFAVFKCVECFNTQLCCWSMCLEESMASRRNHLAEKSKYSVKTGTSFPYLIGNSKVMGSPFISKLKKIMVENGFNVSKATTLACLLHIYSLDNIFL